MLIGKGLLDVKYISYELFQVDSIEEESSKYQEMEA